MPEPTLRVIAQPPRTNRALATLPPGEMTALQPHLEETTLDYKLNLFEKASPVDYVYFVHHGVASLVSALDDGVIVEIATIGPEGLVGLPLYLGAERTGFRAFIQIPGEGARMEADAFRRVLGRCPALHRLLSRHTLALMNQMAQNAACNRAHSVEERCARWLLPTHDRVQAPRFPLTQEFLGQMLGVRRPSVSIAAGMLAKAGLISYVRGQITIRDRPGLEPAACECYGIIADAFERLLGGEEETTDNLSRPSPASGQGAE